MLRFIQSSGQTAALEGERGERCVEVYQLIYFVAVAKYEHITRAAAELHISQSTLSAGLKKLETELELKLYSRTAKGIVLTPEGRIFLHRAARIVSEIDSAEQMMAQLARQSGGMRMRIACAEILGLSGVIYEAEKRMLALEPDMCFSNLFEEYGDNGDLLISGQADLLLTYSHITRAEIEWQKLCDDRLLLVVRDDSPLAGRSFVSMSELADGKLIAPREHCFLRDHLDVLFAELKMFTPINIFICFSETDIPMLVEQGMGRAVVTGLWWKQYCRSRNNARLRAVAIDAAGAGLELGTARLTGLPHRFKCDSIIEIIKDLVKD